MKSKTISGLFVLAVVALGFASSSSANATQYEVNGKIRICHANRSNENSEKPYTNNTVSVNATGNGNNTLNGHLKHTGEEGLVIYNSEVHEEAKDAKKEWGDIIPPTEDHPDGLNWTAEGQRVWESGCGYYVEPEEGVATANISIASATCESGEILVYGAITNASFTGTVNGTEGPATYDVVATANEGAFFNDRQSTLQFTGSLSGPLDGPDCEEEVTEADITAKVACVATDGKSKVTLTLTNSGDADGDVMVNGETVSVPANSDPVVLSYDSGMKVTVVINGETVIDRSFTCGGQGSVIPETPEAPKTPQVTELPYTGASVTPLVAAGALSLAGIILAVGAAIKSRLLA